MTKKEQPLAESSVQTRKGQHAHVEWIDLKGNGLYVECAVMKRDDFGNIFFIEIPAMDRIDKTRIARIISNRNAQTFELWDLMSQITLNNGMNALSYFHQLVKVITPSGIVMNPRAGTVGIGRINVKDPVAAKTAELHAPVESVPVTTRKYVGKGKYANVPVEPTALDDSDDSAE